MFSFKCAALQLNHTESITQDDCDKTVKAEAAALTALNTLLFWEQRGLEKEATNLKSDPEGDQPKHTLLGEEKQHEICHAIKEAKLGERHKASANIWKEEENSEKLKMKFDGATLEHIVSF